MLGHQPLERPGRRGAALDAFHVCQAAMRVRLIAGCRWMMSVNTSRAKQRFRRRNASSFERPSAIRRAAYALVRTTRPSASDREDVQRAVGGAITAAVAAMAHRLATGGRHRAHVTRRREARLRAQAFGIVAGRQLELRGAGATDGVAGHAFRRELIDEIAAHGIEIGNLVSRLHAAPRHGLQADPVRGLDAAIGAQIRLPRRQGPDELHSGDPAQRLAQAFGRTQDGVVDHLQGDAPVSPPSGTRSGHATTRPCHRGCGA